jgi:PAS domain S-box-containing protein
MENLGMTTPLRRFERDRYVRMLFRQFPGAVWTTDINLRLTYFAGRLANNMSPRAQAGMSVYDIVGTRDPANRIIACHHAAILGEPQSFQYRVHDRWYEVIVEQLRDKGEVTGCIAAAFDVTEPRATQERLARSEALLAQAQRLAHVGSFEWEVTTNTVVWSDELHRIYGLQPGQFEGTYEAFLARVHPEDLDRTKSLTFDALRKGTPFVFEYRIVRVDGAVRELQTRGDVVMDDLGKAIRMAGCCWDVTELRDAMNHLLQVRSLLEATIEATADGLLVVDRNGVVTAQNQQFLAMWRIPEEIAGHKDDEKLRAYVCDQLEEPERFLRGTRELYEHPERETVDVLTFKDGRVFERYSRPQRIASQISGRVWSFRDITERERLLRRALFLADAGRLLSSLDVEPALDSVARLSVPFMGETCAIDLLGNGQPKRLLMVSRDGAEPFNPELHSTVMAGHSVIYSQGARSCMAVPLVVKDSVVGAITFISSVLRRYNKADLELAETLARRAALSVENSRLYQKAREALHARDEFLTIAAHEIRGPITSIHLAVQGLRKGKSSESILPHLLEVIEREDRRLRRFVDELLDLGKIQNTQLHFDFETVDLGDIVRDAASELSGELSWSGSSLAITTEGSPVGQWDKSRLFQVAFNLLSNAIKFGEGRPISASVREHQGLTTLVVKDNGIGIQAEMLEKIFKPFERAVSVRHYGGLGLGLFISLTIVEGLGGNIRVESTPKEGSIFTVELPNNKTYEQKQPHRPDR